MPRIGHAWLLLACVPALDAATLPASDGWPVYVNVLHRYHVCYPAVLLIAQGESDNSAGQTFKARDGAQVAVWGDYSGEGSSLGRIADSAASAAAGPRGRITYRASGPTWAVASGEDERGGIFYLKLFKHSDHVAQALLRYPKAQAARYRPVTERISRCFGLAAGF